MNLIPSFIRRRVEHRPNLLKIIDNVSWLLFDKVLRLGAGIIVGVWVARYLGPERFGQLSYAIAFTGLFGVIANLGLPSIVVRDIVRDPDGKEEIIGTAAVLQFFGGLTAYILILGSIFLLRADDLLIRMLVAILGSTMLFKPSEVVVYWFESQIQSKYTVWLQNSCFLLFALIKVILIYKNAALVTFAWAAMAEALAVAILLPVIFSLRGQKLHQLRANFVRAKGLLSDSWPLLLSGVAIVVNMRIDQVMLGQMIGDEAVGIYNAATRISEVWYFAISIIIVSVFPSLTKQHADKNESLDYCWVQLYRLMFWISTVAALLLSITSEGIINVLFGAAYAESSAVLAVHVWAGVNVAIGSIWSKWLLLENKTKIGLYSQLIGAILNTTLNIFLIAEYGIMGAAFSTLISYWVSALFSYTLYKPSKTFGYIYQALFFRGRKIAR